MLSGSADGCGDGDDDSYIEDWISAYLRDHLNPAGEWDSCRDTLSWSVHLASFDRVACSNCYKMIVFPIGMRQAVDDLVYTSVNLRGRVQATAIIPVLAWMLLPLSGSSQVEKLKENKMR